MVCEIRGVHYPILEHSAGKLILALGYEPDQAFLDSKFLGYHTSFRLINASQQFTELVGITVKRVSAAGKSIVVDYVMDVANEDVFKPQVETKEEESTPPKPKQRKPKNLNSESTTEEE
jgi:hypothetical protein